jgi:hypothetical protein
MWNGWDSEVMVVLQINRFRCDICNGDRKTLVLFQNNFLPNESERQVAEGDSAQGSVNTPTITNLFFNCK